jgi:hypothetical protein
MLLLAGIVARGFWSVPPAHAIDGRDFAGFYQLSNVTELVDEVQLTFSVEVLNYSDAEVTNATVTLEVFPFIDPPYGSFPAVSMLDRESVALSSHFTIPAEEFDRWQVGANPSLFITYTGANGNLVKRAIELTPMLVVVEE